MNCRECCQSNGLCSCKWCGYGPFCSLCAETNLMTRGNREWECSKCEQSRCPEALKLTKEQLLDQKIIQEAEKKRAAAHKNIREAEEKRAAAPRLTACQKCTAQEHHWCENKNYVCFLKCSGCGGYDDHYCQHQGRHITICTRCQCDDRMCFCC